MHCPLRGRGEGLLRIRRVVALIVTAGLAVAGCASEDADRNAADTTAVPVSAAAAPATAAGVDSNIPTSADSSVGTATATAAAPSPDADEEPSRNQDEVGGDSLLATPSAALVADEKSDGEGAVEIVGEESSTPPPPSEDDDPSGEEADEEITLSVDKVEVLSSSITVRDCVVRGLVHNKSDKMFARNVVITFFGYDGGERVEWHWPLTMQPGEVAPFEIEISWSSEDIDFEVAADMSGDPDVSRSFLVNYDGTPRDWPNNNWEPYIEVFDERYYALEGTDIRMIIPYQNSFIHEDLFHQYHPEFLIKSNDVDAIVSLYDGQDFSDVYFKPEVMFPELLGSSGIVSIDNVRIYQAIMDSSTVVDVRELVPYSIEDERDPDGSLVRRTIVPVRQISNLTPGEEKQFYILQTVPQERSVHHPFYTANGWHQRLWMGNGTGTGPFDSEAQANGVLNSSDLRGSLPAPCDLPAGGLTWRNATFLKSAQFKADEPMGYFGVFRNFDPSRDFVGKLVVDRKTVTIADGVIRGEIRNLSDRLGTPLLGAQRIFIHASSEDGSAAWAGVWLTHGFLDPHWNERFEIIGWRGSTDVDQIDFKVFGTVSVWDDGEEDTGGSLYRDYPSQHLNDKVVIESETVGLVNGVIRGLVINLSDRSFARDVIVTAITKDGNKVGTSWRWPLTVQPGERAPFEISGWRGSANFEDIEFKVSSSLSERVDISRSFQIFRSKVGIVYREGMEEQYRQERYAHPPIPMVGRTNVLYHYEDEFIDLYSHILNGRDELGPQGLFYFDYHAELEKTDSHPHLNDEIKSQVILDLKAYVAFFNSDMEVVAIKELEPFTAIYQPPEYEPELILVRSVPTPSNQAPHSVRLLVTIPREDVQHSNSYQFSQIWIGGALEPLS